MAKFVDIYGVIAKARRFVSGAANVNEEEVKNPTKLAEILRGILARVTDIEANLPPPSIDFEIEVGAEGELAELHHNMNTNVRYYVVFWTKTRTGSYPAAAPVLVADETSTDNILVLRSSSEGRAVVRVEPAFKGIDYNVV